MRSITNFRLCVGFAVAVGLAVPAQAATTFYFQFDNQGLVPGDGPLSGPIVGTGTFTSPTDLTPGTYGLTSLAGFSLAFSFNDGNGYTTSDILTPLTGVAVRIADAGGGVERLFFTESGGTGGDGGPNGGALDLGNGTVDLSFEPTYFGGNYLYEEGGGGPNEGGYVGRYLALSSIPGVPEPSTWAMMLLGFGAIGYFARRKVSHRSSLARA